MMDVIGFGAINLDEIYVVPSLAALPGPKMLSGSEQTVNRREYDRLTTLVKRADARRLLSGGGQAANTLYALARLGFQTAIISTVGADAEGDSLLEGLAPVDTSQVLRRGLTRRCAVIVDSRGERTICVLLSPEEAPSPDPVSCWQSLGGARYLHLTSLTRPEALAAQAGLVGEMPDHVQVSFDPGELYCRLGAEALAPILDRADVLFLNEREAELLTGRPAFQGCRDLLTRADAVLVCKKGSRGVEVIGRGEGFDVPAREVAAVDPTGAGDVFAAGFLAGLLLGLTLERCALLGSEAAARSVTGYGRSSYPGPELLESLGISAPLKQGARGDCA